MFAVFRVANFSPRVKKRDMRGKVGNSPREDSSSAKIVGAYRSVHIVFIQKLAGATQCRRTDPAIAQNRYAFLIGACVHDPSMIGS
jgi:hypothetical protein